MMRAAAACVRYLLLTCTASMLLCQAARAGEFEFHGMKFTLPEGFTLEIAAETPIVDRPITCDFDEQGALYVADSSGSNDNVQKQLQERPHRILKLIDTDGDGRFDRRTVFADKMMFPEGTLWHAGSLYVSAPPSIWKLTDTNGDGIADERSEWFQGKTLTGCANDLHGPYLGPDGWIYWAKGAFAEQTYERPGREPFKTRASHLFRARPDGTGIEPVMTGGMDNPVDVVFTPGGERIFTTTFLVHPGGGERDGLLHAVYGGVHGKVHAVLDGHIRTSPDVLPVLCHLGPAAPCGLARYESSTFGKEYSDNLFAALFNLQKITRHVLKPQGGTFACETHDFLVCDSKDFHPTDVQMDADGSLIVVDTGGWYKLCCPTSQLHKPDVLGAIYRIRKTGAPRVADPRGNKLDWAHLEPVLLAERLGDSRVAVRQRAIETLAKRGESAIAILRGHDARPSPVEYHLSAVSTACRIDHPSAREYIRKRLKDRQAEVQLLAIHAVSLWRDRDAVPALIEIVSDNNPAAGLQRRAAAEALGRMGDKSAIPALLKALSPAVDPILTHSLIYALVELEHPEATAQGLASSSPETRAGALIALDQMRDGKLRVDQVATDLASTNPRLRETAAWIATRHPEWGNDLADLLRKRFGPGLSPEERSDLERLFARFAGSGAIQELLAKRLLESPTADDRLLVLRAMSHSGQRSIPAGWLAGWKTILEGNDEALISATCNCIRALALGKEQAPQLAELVPALRAIGERKELGAPTRLEALALLPPGTLTPDAALFQWLQNQFDPNTPVLQRMTAADVLARAKLSRPQLESLFGTLAHAGPIEADRLLGAFEQLPDEQLGLQLVGTLKSSSALTGLRIDALKARFAKYPQPVQQAAQELYAVLNADAARQQQKLEELLANLKDGDIRRGQLVFNSTRAACNTCHAIGYLGGKVGPDLTRIGQIRNERDLLESIVFPSASFVRSYEPAVAVMTDGRIVTGILKKDAPDEVILVKGPKEEFRLPRNEIEELRPGTVSVMPAGLDQQLTPQDLADLVTFLRACR